MKKLICKKYASRKGGKKQYDDILDAWDEMPTGWWLEHHSIVHVLAVMVHRQSPTIIAAAAHADPGPTRDQQRAAVAESIGAERRIESSKHHQQSKPSAVDSALENTLHAWRA